MEYRDDRDAILQRAENLEEELAAANQRLAEARERFATQAEKDEKAERRVAELQDEVNELRRRLGLAPARIAGKKAESSKAATVVLLSVVVVALMAAAGVGTYVAVAPSAAEAPPSSSPTPLLIIGGVFALVGLPFVWLAFHTFNKDRAIAKWPRAPGKILTSRVQSSTYTAKDNQGYYREYESHSPKVSYTYVVDGTEYEGSTVARSVANTSNRSAVQKCIDRYPAGGEVMVLYDPADPRIAYLEVRRSIGAMILLGLGGLFSAVGLLLVVLFFTV